MNFAALANGPSSPGACTSSAIQSLRNGTCAAVFFSHDIIRLGDRFDRTLSTLGLSFLLTSGVRYSLPHPLPLQRPAGCGALVTCTSARRQRCMVLAREPHRTASELDGYAAAPSPHACRSRNDRPSKPQVSRFLQFRRLPKWHGALRTALDRLSQPEALVSGDAGRCASCSCSRRGSSATSSAVAGSESACSCYSARSCTRYDRLPWWMTGPLSCAVRSATPHTPSS